MAEPQKGASLSAKAKEKTSLLDLDIGKDFLSSWTSMSVAEDMDFDFGTVAKGKKKIFNFDKMDMDFNLDGDFDKISSFKVDMSDLDISSDAKELENPRKKSKEVSAGENDQGKTDRFAFTFDFNKLDGISFESTLMEEDKKSNKNKDREGSLNRSGCQGSEIHLSEDVGALEENINLKLPASQGVISSKGDAQVGGVGNLDSTNVDCTSKSVAHDNCSSKSANFVDQVAIQGARFSPQKTISTCTQESDQESHQPVKTTSPESYAQDLSVQSISRNASPRDTNSELQEEVSTSATELSTSTGGEQNANVKVIADSGSNYEKSMLENLPTQHMVSSQSNNSDRKKFGGDNHAPIGDKDGAESAEGDLHFEYTSITNVSRELVHDTPSNGENQVSHAKPLVAPLNSGATVDKLMLGNERETGVIRSKYFKRSDETESQLQQGSFSQKNLSSFGSKRIGTVQLSPADERRECDAKDPHSGSKLAGISWPKPRELPRGKLVQAGSREIVKSLNSTGEGFNADGTETGSKLIATSRPHVEDVTKGGIVLGGSVKNNKALNTLNSHVHPSSLSEQTNKSTTQNVNPRLPVSSMTSIQNIKKFCVERNIISPLHAGKKTPDLSSLRISRTTGANHDPLNSRPQKDSKSLRISEQNMELQRNTQSKMTHYADKEKQTSLSPILKRKIFEEPNADMLTLNPSKRLSESPSESRNSRDPSERVVTKQVCNHENLTEGNNRNAFIDYQIPALGIPREINMTELEAPLAMENDSNVEKAEACTKELEDICNMLKKKHEEAKEILVRAIVNNNNLLMLNHPIYEEKIYMIQKFAASLMSKELFT